MSLDLAFEHSSQSRDTKKSKPSAPKAELRPPVTKHASPQQPKPKPAPAKSQENKYESVDEGIHKKEPRFDDEEADIQREVEESLKSVHDAPRGPLPSVTPKKVCPAEQYIFQRHTPASTEPSCHAESPSNYAALGLTDSASESDEEVPHVVEVEAQDEEPQPQSSLVVHAGPNLKHMDLEATDVSTQLHPEQMDEGFTATAYPNV
uniref:Uncharacterized protein n=1 Tax=Tanacetum cinerariifolium TaxID=118510 RepID=A0A6L2N734_TANCI|nr:hypothetical protein [Tanacetum cinerariifolium]